MKKLDSFGFLFKLLYRASAFVALWKVILNDPQPHCSVGAGECFRPAHKKVPTCCFKSHNKLCINETLIGAENEQHWGSILFLNQNNKSGLLGSMSKAFVQGQFVLKWILCSDNDQRYFYPWYLNSLSLGLKYFSYSQIFFFN